LYFIIARRVFSQNFVYGGHPPVQNQPMLFCF